MTLLRCQHDPWLRHLDAQLLSCTPREDGRFDLVLDDTILYAEGGGQPADRGEIAGVPVLDVQRDAAGRAVHLTGQALAPGPVRVTLDWTRRFDHMQQHSAQHLLTAIAQDQLGFATIGFHLGELSSTIDLDTPELSNDALQRLDALTNDAVRDAVPISTRLVGADALPTLGVRTRGLPEGHVGPVRLVEIEGIDLNTCGGTHLRSTAQLQLVHLLRTERTRGRVRLHFVAGHRAQDLLREGLELQRRLTEQLRCAPPEHEAAARRLVEDNKEAARALRHAQGQLAQALALNLTSGPPGPAAFHAEDADPAFLNTLANAALGIDAERLLLLTAAPAGRAEGAFLLAGPAALVARLGPEVARALQGRGGGARGRFQGRAERVDPDTRAEALALIKQASP